MAPFLSINSFDLQLKVNLERRIPSDFYYVKSYIGFSFGDSQHVIFINGKGIKFYASADGKQYKRQNKKINLKPVIYFLHLHLIHEITNYFVVHGVSCMYFIAVNEILKAINRLPLQFVSPKVYL
jgi:hypothetical protein